MDIMFFSWRCCMKILFQLEGLMLLGYHFSVRGVDFV